MPAAGLIVTSFRTTDAVNSSGWWHVVIPPLDPAQFTLDNYRQAWNGGMAESYLSSLAVTLPAVFIPLLIAGFAAYAFTFMTFPGRTILFPLIVSLLIVPSQVALAPLLRIYSDVHLNGTYAAVYLAHIGFGMPLAVFLLRAFMANLPRAVIDCARVDGASHFHVFWRVVVPMSAPAFAAFAVFQFLSVWNDLLIALIFLNEGPLQTVTMTLGGQIGQVGGRGWQAVSGAALIALSVPVLVSLVLQRYFIRGLTTGSVGG